MKKILLWIISFLFIVVIALTISPLTDRIAGLLTKEPTVIIAPFNNYYRDANFSYVWQSEDYVPYSTQDLKNIFYSALNNGWETFTFYCPSQYVTCIEDVKDLTENNDILTHINNFVAPFNSFKVFSVSSASSGEVTIEIERLYENDVIRDVNNKIDEIINTLITDDMNDEEKIRTIHNHILENAYYDVFHETSSYSSNLAYGALIEGFAICSGFTDTMALFLNRFNIPNFRIASENHVWNAVYIDGRWLHLDLTWDNPTDENDPYNRSIIHKFFMVSTETLESYEITNHDFDYNVYHEVLS